MTLVDALKPWQPKPDELVILHYPGKGGTIVDNNASRAVLRRVKERANVGRVRMGLEPTAHSWIMDGIRDGARTVYARRTFTEKDRNYATTVQGLVDVAVEKFEDQQTDPYALRAEVMERLEQLPQQRKRRETDNQKDEHNGDFFAALTDWTLVHGLLTCSVYQEAADMVADQLQSGRSLLPNEDEKRKYLDGKKVFEHPTQLEPQLWQHIEAVAYWISRTQHQFWESAFSGRHEGNLKRDLIEMEQKAATRNEPFVEYWIRLKERDPDLSADHIKMYKDSLICNSPDTMLVIGDPVQNSFRALTLEYLRSQSDTDPLHAAFQSLGSAPKWAGIKARRFPAIFGSVSPPVESLSINEFVDHLQTSAKSPLVQTLSKSRMTGRCPAIRGGHRPTKPDALFQFMQQKYDQMTIPTTIRATERLTAIHLCVAAESGVFNVIENARA